MAYYAFLDENNVVTHVIRGEEETVLIEGLPPEEWYGNYVGQPCKRTSFNGNIRYNYAGIGFTFDPTVQPDGAFYAPQPFPSWVLDSTYKWQAPVPYPTDGGNYRWDEETLSWVTYGA